MRASEDVTPGAKKKGFVAEMELKVPPLAKAFRKEVFAPEARLKMLFGEAGDRAGVMLPVGAIVKVFDTGEFVERLSTSTAGNESPKIPIPPRITVLLLSNGL